MFNTSICAILRQAFVNRKSREENNLMCFNKMLQNLHPCLLEDLDWLISAEGRICCHQLINEHPFGRVGSNWVVLGPSNTNEGLYIFIVVCLLSTYNKLEKRRKRKKDEEREVPDPRESIEDTPTINVHQISSTSDFREQSCEQNNYSN